MVIFYIPAEDLLYFGVKLGQQQQAVTIVRTFVNHRHLEWDADDAHQVWGGDQGAEDGSDTQRLAFTCVNELWHKRKDI